MVVVVVVVIVVAVKMVVVLKPFKAEFLARVKNPGRAPSRFWLRPWKEVVAIHGRKEAQILGLVLANASQQAAVAAAASQHEDYLRKIKGDEDEDEDEDDEEEEEEEEVGAVKGCEVFFERE
ncbi:hypothetical protein M0802_004928 [Mischocyttarus mexicanus]|nr:hypothetical protein M0802_004928 [Mischocyttarus mexicanus]